MAGMDLYPPVEPDESGHLDVSDGADHLIGDLERLRIHLGIVRWVVAGVSWGGDDGVMPEKHSRPVPGGRAFYLTERLWELSAGLPVEQVPIDDIAEFDQDCWFGGAAVTCRMVARH